MKPLFDITKLADYKSNDLLPFECEFCGKTFYWEQKQVKYSLKQNRPNQNKTKQIKFCSIKCGSAYKSETRTKEIKCEQCSKTIRQVLSEILRNKHHFCSRSCATRYLNLNKHLSVKSRSKLEFWIEEQLKLIFPQLEILYCDREAINGELDIYIPSLKLAFELNGIVHYEPIFGIERLASIKTNDQRKFQACLEHNIELVIIDISRIKNFKPKKGKLYLDIIADIISEKIFGPVE